jgi:hypothetical protein
MEGTYEDVRVEKQNEKNGAFVCLIKNKTPITLLWMKETDRRLNYRCARDTSGLG